VPKFKTRCRQLKAVDVSREINQVRKNMVAAEARIVLMKKETEKIEVET